jgi:hypothetical protein
MTFIIISISKDKWKQALSPLIIDQRQPMDCFFEMLLSPFPPWHMEPISIRIVMDSPTWMLPKRVYSLYASDVGAESKNSSIVTPVACFDLNGESQITVTRNAIFYGHFTAVGRENIKNLQTLALSAQLRLL